MELADASGEYTSLSAARGEIFPLPRSHVKTGWDSPNTPDTPEYLQKRKEHKSSHKIDLKCSNDKLFRTVNYHNSPLKSDPQNTYQELIDLENEPSSQFEEKNLIDFDSSLYRMTLPSSPLDSSSLSFPEKEHPETPPGSPPTSPPTSPPPETPPPEPIDNLLISPPITPPGTPPIATPVTPTVSSPRAKPFDSFKPKIKITGISSDSYYIGEQKHQPINISKADELKQSTDNSNELIPPPQLAPTHTPPRTRFLNRFLQNKYQVRPSSSSGDVKNQLRLLRKNSRSLAPTIIPRPSTGISHNKPLVSYSQIPNYYYFQSMRPKTAVSASDYIQKVSSRSSILSRASLMGFNKRLKAAKCIQQWWRCSECIRKARERNLIPTTQSSVEYSPHSLIKRTSVPKSRFRSFSQSPLPYTQNSNSSQNFTRKLNIPLSPSIYTRYKSSSDNSPISKLKSEFFPRNDSSHISVISVNQRLDRPMTADAYKSPYRSKSNYIPSSPNPFRRRLHSEHDQILSSHVDSFPISNVSPQPLNLKSTQTKHPFLKKGTRKSYVKLHQAYSNSNSPLNEKRNEISPQIKPNNIIRPQTAISYSRRQLHSDKEIIVSNPQLSLPLYNNYQNNQDESPTPISKSITRKFLRKGAGRWSVPVKSKQQESSILPVKPSIPILRTSKNKNFLLKGAGRWAVPARSFIKPKLSQIQEISSPISPIPDKKHQDANRWAEPANSSYKPTINQFMEDNSSPISPIPERNHKNSAFRAKKHTDNFRKSRINSLRKSYSWSENEPNSRNSNLQELKSVPDYSWRRPHSSYDSHKEFDASRSGLLELQLMMLDIHKALEEKD